MRAKSLAAVLGKYQASGMGPLGVDSAPSSSEWVLVVSRRKILLPNFSPTSSLSSLEDVWGQYWYPTKERLLFPMRWRGVPRVLRIGMSLLLMQLRLAWMWKFFMGWIPSC